MQIGSKEIKLLGISAGTPITIEVLDKALAEKGGEEKAPKDVINAYHKLITVYKMIPKPRTNIQSSAPVKIVKAAVGSKICDHCHGTGDEPGAKGKPDKCPTCSHLRQEMPFLFEGNVAEKCPSCGGSGHGSDHDVTCTGCGGSGIYNVPCKACNGEGCVACKGKGYTKSQECKKCGGTGSTCPDCDRGMVKIRKCSTCKGQGTIIMVPNCSVCGGVGFIEPKDETNIEPTTDDSGMDAA